MHAPSATTDAWWCILVSDSAHFRAISVLVVQLTFLIFVELSSQQSAVLNEFNDAQPEPNPFISFIKRYDPILLIGVFYPLA